MAKAASAFRSSDLPAGRGGSSDVVAIMDFVVARIGCVAGLHRFYSRFNRSRNTLACQHIPADKSLERLQFPQCAVAGHSSGCDLASRLPE
jgi:hypothetical protein